MDQQKTGALIAEQRKKLGLTQKQLAEKLTISDRTVSKWERGAGFPDISLIEPLADVLDLTVLDLFRGEIEQTTPEEETTAREVLSVCGPQVKETITRARRWILVMAVILALLLAALPWLISNAHGVWIEFHDIKAEEAVAITPDILISTADNDLLDCILEHEEISAAYTSSFSDRLYLATEQTAAYREKVSINGEMPLFMDILASFDNLTVSYGTHNTHIILEIHKDDISKQVILCEYPYLTEDGENIPMGQRHGNRIDLMNSNNETFQQGGYQTGWLEFFRTTYY